MPRRRRGGVEALSPWPGYVDALSTLLMVLVFVLLVFVVSQAFLNVALNGRDQALERLNRQVVELADLLSLERGKTAELTDQTKRLEEALRVGADAVSAAGEEAAGLRARLTRAEADAAQAEALRQRLHDRELELQSAGARLSAAMARLAGAEDAAAARREAAGRIDTLTEQVAALTARLAAVQAALDGARKAGAEKDARIADLGTRLNAALLGQVEELKRYRSEFFGRLRQVLAGRPGISEVGDRFVFQSEVLFPAGSAELTPKGAEQIRGLAATLKDIAARIPRGVGWVLRVDGHADRQAVSGRFASNWELSAARAISVVRLLIAQGVPPARLAAAGFGEFQPLDGRDRPDAYARNRRIELRLTDR